MYYLLTKTDGKPWQEDPAVERLVEVRTVSNTEDKMKCLYHVEKDKYDF